MKQWIFFFPTLMTMSGISSAFNLFAKRSTSVVEMSLSSGGNEIKSKSFDNAQSRRGFLSVATIAASAAPSVMFPRPSYARLDPVNRPDLLPKEPGLNVIQVEKFLTQGQVKRLDSLLTSLEKDTGFRLRVLCQAYPETPGLAIRDYWSLGKEGQKDDKYAVLVVDQFGGKGNALNFNVGEGLKLNLPNVFWTRLQGKYGTTFFVRENGIDLAITNAIEAIIQCLRSEDAYCVNVPDEGFSLKKGF